jgi:hypothetical protein
MLELLAVLYVLGVIGTFLVLHTVVETRDADVYGPTASKNTIIVREAIIAALWPGLVLLTLIMLILPDKGEGIRHWILTGES